MIPRSLGVRSILAASLAILLALVIVGAGVEVLVSRHPCPISSCWTSAFPGSTG